MKFKPELPSWKLGAIDRMGNGLLNKVILRFPSVFWDSQCDVFGRVSNHTESRGEFFMFWSMHRTQKSPILIAMVAGEAAVGIEDLEDRVIIKKVVDSLRAMFPSADIPEPLESRVTRWNSDPMSMGSYSYVAVGSTGDDYDVLAKPVDNAVFFAGESTCKEHPATVSGAFSSGLREARRIALSFGRHVAHDLHRALSFEGATTSDFPPTS